MVYPNDGGAVRRLQPGPRLLREPGHAQQGQAAGRRPGGPAVLGSRIDGRYFWSSPADGTACTSTTWRHMVWASPKAVPRPAPTRSSEWPGHLRPPGDDEPVQQDATFNPTIDGFTITGGDQQGFADQPQLPRRWPERHTSSGQRRGAGRRRVRQRVRASNTRSPTTCSSRTAARSVAPSASARPSSSSAGLNPNNNTDNVRILRNRIVANGGTNLAGAIGIFYGSDGYEIVWQRHLRQLQRRVRRRHQPLRPQPRRHASTTTGSTSTRPTTRPAASWSPARFPPTPPCSSPAPGAVTIDHNEIIANLSNDDGGGVRFLMAAGPNQRPDDRAATTSSPTTWPPTKVAASPSTTHPDVRIVNNTIVKNITTATAMTSDGLPAPAGVSTGANSALLQARLNRHRWRWRTHEVLQPGAARTTSSGTTGRARGPNAGVAGIGLAGDPSPILRWDVGTTDGSGTPTLYGSVYDSSPASPLYHGGTGFSLGTGRHDLGSQSSTGSASRRASPRCSSRRPSTLRCRWPAGGRSPASVRRRSSRWICRWHSWPTTTCSRPAARRRDWWSTRAMRDHSPARQRQPERLLPSAAPTTDIDDQARPVPAGVPTSIVAPTSWHRRRTAGTAVARHTELLLDSLQPSGHYARPRERLDQPYAIPLISPMGINANAGASAVPAASRSGATASLRSAPTSRRVSPHRTSDRGGDAARSAWS